MHFRSGMVRFRKYANFFDGDIGLDFPLGDLGGLEDVGVGTDALDFLLSDLPGQDNHFFFYLNWLKQPLVSLLIA